MTAEELMERASAREILEYQLLFELHEDERTGDAQPDEEPEPDDPDADADPGPDLQALIQEQAAIIDRIIRGDSTEST